MGISVFVNIAKKTLRQWLRVYKTIMKRLKVIKINFDSELRKMKPIVDNAHSIHTTQAKTLYASGKTVFELIEAGVCSGIIGSVIDETVC